MADSTSVFRKGRPIGSLERTRYGGRFTYEKAWLDARGPEDIGVAFQMPPKEEPYESDHVPSLPPYFVNLLPEGALLGKLARRVGVGPSDLLSLLAAFGADAVGDVTVGAESPASARLSSDLSFSEAYRRLMVDSSLPLPIDAIPGVQPKITANRITLPYGVEAGPGAFIKLTTDERFPRAEQNEAFFMSMARDCGLPAARTELISDSAGECGLLVHRFDRRGKGRSIRMLHQEDACQLLDLYPLDKYQVSVEEIGLAVRRIVSGWPANAMALILQFAFGYLIGNHDQHAKNVSVLEVDPHSSSHMERSADRAMFAVSPVYDMLCTLAYGDPLLALKLNGKDHDLTRDDLLALGREFELPERAVSLRLDRMLSRAAPWLDRLSEIGLDRLLTERLHGGLSERLAALRG